MPIAWKVPHVLIDTHCHLTAREFDADRSRVVEAAAHAGLARILVQCVDRTELTAVPALCREYPLCAPALGFHPLWVGQARPADLDALRRALTEHRPVAVGEVGMDFYVPGFDAALQEFFLAEQLRIARDFDLPVILHTRKAQDPVLKQLRRFGVRQGVAHAFNGSEQQAGAYLKLGFKLGFGGAMTWPRALRIRRLAATLPLESLVLETDAPDIPPVFLGRARNSPETLPGIAAALAGLRGLEPAELIAATGRNALEALPGLSTWAATRAAGVESGASAPGLPDAIVWDLGRLRHDLPSARRFEARPQPVRPGGAEGDHQGEGKGAGGDLDAGHQQAQVHAQLAQGQGHGQQLHAVLDGGAHRERPSHAGALEAAEQQAVEGAGEQRAEHHDQQGRQDARQVERDGGQQVGHQGEARRRGQARADGHDHQPVDGPGDEFTQPGAHPSGLQKGLDPGALGQLAKAQAVEQAQGEPARDPGEGQPHDQHEHDGDESRQQAAKPRADVGQGRAEMVPESVQAELH